jgi:Capsule polysaccharide biosynthesis protein.
MKFLLFGHERLVVPHFVSLCVLGSALRHLGHNILVAQCDGFLDRCVTFDAFDIAPGPSKQKRETVCGSCRSKHGASLNALGARTVQMSRHLDRETLTMVDAAVQSLPADLLSNNHPYQRLIKAAARDVTLVYKVVDLNALHPEQRLRFVETFRATLLTYLLIGRLVREEAIDGLIVFNEYAINHAARLAARENGARAFCISNPSHNNNDRRFLVVVNPDQQTEPSHYARICTDQWPEWRPTPLRPQAVRMIGDDVLLRLSGHGAHTYSPGRTSGESVLAALPGYSRGRKLLVAYTSALEEQFSARMMMTATGPDTVPVWEQPFKTQIEWLETLIDFVASQPDLQLVVRIHPREGANKREGRVSTHLAMLKEAFGQRALPRTWFVWPEDSMSSYDLGEMADVVLTSWSSIGIEMSRVGVPLLFSFKQLVSYPEDKFAHFSVSKSGYVTKLRTLLDWRTSLEDITLAFRWYHAFSFGPCLDMSDVVQPPRMSLARPAALPLVDRIFVKGENPFAVCREHAARLVGGNAGEAERTMILTQIRRIVVFLLTGQDSSEPDLHVIVGDERVDDRQNLSAPGRAILTVEAGNVVRYEALDRRIERYSPMVARLGRILHGESRSLLSGAEPAQPEERA